MKSYAAGETTPALIEETIGANFERIAHEFADREALVEVASGRRWTYVELDRDVNAFARGLITAGVVKGDRVGIWSPNCAEWTLVQYATAKIGAILVNINPAYRSPELQFVLGQAGISLLVSATAFKASDYAAMIAEVRAHCPDLQTVVLLGSADWEDMLETGGRALESEADLLTSAQSELSADEPINIQY